MSTIATSLSRSRRLRAAALAAVVMGVISGAPGEAAERPLPVLVLLPGSGRDVSAAIVKRGRWLMGQRLGWPGRFVVIDHDGPPTEKPVTASEAAAIARSHGASMAVSFDMSREGAQTILTLTCFGASSAEPLCELTEATAAGPELLPELTEWLAGRLLRALSQPPGTVASGGTAPSTVSGSTAAGAARATTIGVRVGLVVPVVSPAQKLTLLGGLAAILNVDSDYVLVELGAEYASGDGQRLLGLGLGLFAPLHDEGNTLYWGANICWVDQRLGGRGAQGIALRPTLGILWGRRATARTRLEAAYFVDLFRERKLDRLIPGSDGAVVAHGLTIATVATF